MAANLFLNRFVFPNPGYSVRKNDEIYVADVLVAANQDIEFDKIYRLRDFPKSVYIIFKDECMYNEETAIGKLHYCIISNPIDLPLKNFYFTLLETEKRHNVGLIYTLSKV